MTLKTEMQEAAEQIDAARERFEGMRAELDREMQQKFAEWDGTGSRDTLGS